MNSVYSTDIPGYQLFRRGKVRDVYDLGEHLLIVATDRISAFDVIMREAIPCKGRILTGISLFWFGKTGDLVPNHVLTADLAGYPRELLPYAAQLEGRSMIVRKTQPVPIECVVRGYLAGSAWKEYQEKGSICGIPLPSGLSNGAQLPEPIFTPATKAEEGHDENITYEQAVASAGADIMDRCREMSLRLYKFAGRYLADRNLIVADTKFEFGVARDGQLLLIDEALTPDSSRFWLREEYRAGAEQYNFDKQKLRDYLETTDWNKEYPPPQLPAEIIALAVERYSDAFRRITGQEFKA